MDPVYIRTVEGWWRMQKQLVCVPKPVKEEDYKENICSGLDRENCKVCRISLIRAKSARKQSALGCHALGPSGAEEYLEHD